MRSLFSTLAILTALLWSGVAFAQASPSAYTTGYRFDVQQRLTGLIKPDPDGVGALKFAAERYTYDADGLLVRKEVGELTSWQSQSVVPASWTGFTVLQATYYTYDSVGRKLTERMKGSNGATYSLTQYSYDDAGRLQCSVVRMNESQFASPPSDACVPGNPVSVNGQDRVTKNFYDAAGQLVQVHQAVGTSIEQAYVTYSFTANGKQEHVIDANGNRAKFEYDGFDRQSKWIFPSNTVPASFNPATPATALATAGSVNASDYEQYGYDAAGNRTSLRKRDGTTITYQFDALGRMSVKSVPDTRPELDSSHTRDVYYSYDLLGFQTAARFDGTSGPGGINVYDGFGRLQSATDSLIFGSPALTFQYDKNGNRTKITHPDNVVFDMVFDGGNRLVQVKKGTTVLVAPSYNSRGLVAGADRFNAALDTTLGYDPAGRLSNLTLQYGSNSSNVSWTVSGRNPASQIKAVARNNDAYAWTERVDANSNYATNGLNQYTQIGAAGFCYDANGNLTADSEKSYLYDVENRLVEMRERESASSCPVGASGYSGALFARLHYDPMGHLYEALAYTSGTLIGTSRFLYDGDAMVLEYDGANIVRDRYVHGNDVGADDPLIWYAGVGSADTDIRNLYGDLRGSIAAVVGQNGSTIAINTYDEWGAPATANQGRFQYTGQVWLPEIGMYYYKARIYSPRLGRFMQADPVGYDDQINLYAYVANDPVNKNDPTGQVAVVDDAVVVSVVVVVGAAAIACEVTGACEKFSKAVYEGFDRLGDYISSNDNSSSSNGDSSSSNGDSSSSEGSKKPVSEGVRSGSRGAVPGTGRRAGDVKPAWVKPGKDGPPRTGPKGKKSDGPKTATRGGPFGGVQGSRTQGGKFKGGKGGDGRSDPDGHRGGPGHDHPPKNDGGNKEGHWWWPW